MQLLIYYLNNFKIQDYTCIFIFILLLLQQHLSINYIKVEFAIDCNKTFTLKSNIASNIFNSIVIVYASITRNNSFLITWNISINNNIKTSILIIFAYKQYRKLYIIVLRILQLRNIVAQATNEKRISKLQKFKKLLSSKHFTRYCQDSILNISLLILIYLRYLLLTIIISLLY